MSKKRRKARKKISNQLRAKRLIKKYGNWIALHSDWTGKIIPDCEITEYDAFRFGWKDLWHMCINELNPIVHKLGIENELYFQQIKEKYGELRVYTNMCPREVTDVIDKYSVISANVCQWCGRPDSPISKGGWVDCKCKECDERDQKERGSYKLPYEERYNTDPEHCKISNIHKYTHWSNGVREDVVIDISDTVNKYRLKWNNKENRKKARHKMNGVID